MNEVQVVLVTYKPDKNQPRHGHHPPLEHQAKIIGVNDEVRWLDYPHQHIVYPQNTAKRWAELLGVAVKKVDLSKVQVGKT